MTLTTNMNMYSKRTTKTKKMLDWLFIEDQWTQYATSEEVKEKIKGLDMMVDPYLIQNAIEETQEARALLDMSSSVPLHGLEGIKGILDKLKREEVLRANDFWQLSGFIKDCEKMKQFMVDKAYAAPKITAYALSIHALDDAYQSIIHAVYHSEVLNSASSALARIRKQIDRTEADIKAKLQNYISGGQYANVLTNPLISQRNGRYVIPVKSEHKKTIGGQIHDRSRSGGTIFVEPESVRKLHDALSTLKIEEENEIYRLLAELTNDIAKDLSKLWLNYECMVTYDFLFSKGKLSKLYDGHSAEISPRGDIKIVSGRHPLLGKGAVPLTLELKRSRRNLVITGPNTGGKTVTMKTIGLFCMMMQHGLQLPCEDGTSLPLFENILCDIGDGQSVEQNLSTFSSHITNINDILEEAHSKSLVILDEIGSGTDPSEGMGIGIAVLEALNKKGTYILASTHYGEIKQFATTHPDFISGSMGFDIKTLSPLYRLTLNEVGESSALHIALRLGMDKALIERAHELAYHAKKTYENQSYQEIEEIDCSKANLISEPVSDDTMRLKESRSPFEPKKKSKFKVGDNVLVHTMKRTGIVAETENSKGEVTVLVMGRKIKVNYKRLSLHIEGSELYPEDYDMNIVLKSKEQRKVGTALRKGKKGVVGDGA